MPRSPHRASLSFRGLLCCLVPPLIWGGMFPVAAHLAPTVNMFMMTLVRYAVVAVILVLLLARFESLSALRTDAHGFRLFLLGSAGFAGFGLLAFTALSYTSSTNVSLIMAMMPAIGAGVAAIATRKWPPAFTVAAIIVAFLGVALVLTGGNVTNLVSGHDALGELLALLGAICWVLYTRGAATVPTWSILRYTTVTTILGVPTIAVATAVATATGFVWAPSLSAVLAGWPELSYLVVLAGVVAVLSWNQGNRDLGPINGTLFMNLVPVTTFTVVSISTGTLPGMAAQIGVGLVIAAVVLNNVLTRRAHTASDSTAPAGR